MNVAALELSEKLEAKRKRTRNPVTPGERSNQFNGDLERLISCVYLHETATKMIYALMMEINCGSARDVSEMDSLIVFRVANLRRCTCVSS